MVPSGEQPVDAIQPAPPRSDCEGGSSKLTIPLDYKCLPSEAEIDDLGAVGKIDWVEEIRQAKLHPNFPAYISNYSAEAAEGFEFGSPDGDQAEDLKDWVRFLRQLEAGKARDVYCLIEKTCTWTQVTFIMDSSALLTHVSHVSQRRSADSSSGRQREAHDNREGGLA